MDLNGYEKETMNGGRGLEGAAEYNKCSVEREWKENQGDTLCLKTTAPIVLMLT